MNRSSSRTCRAMRSASVLPTALMIAGLLAMRVGPSTTGGMVPPRQRMMRRWSRSHRETDSPGSRRGRSGVRGRSVAPPLPPQSPWPASGSTSAARVRRGVRKNGRSMTMAAVPYHPALTAMCVACAGGIHRRSSRHRSVPRRIESSSAIEKPPHRVLTLALWLLIVVRDDLHHSHDIGEYGRHLRDGDIGPRFLRVQERLQPVPPLRQCLFIHGEWQSGEFRQ